MKSENKICQNCKLNFTIESEDFNFYQKMSSLGGPVSGGKVSMPPPTFCPDCRFQRRLLFRNNRVFYRRQCALCSKSMLSVYHKDRPYIVYCRECWLSDKWDPMSYGMDYNFSLPFFEQFLELQKKVPRSNMYQTNFVNSEYCNYGKDFRDCYLVFGGWRNERVYFGNQIHHVRDSVNIAFSDNIEFSSGLFECVRANKLFFSQYSNDCVDSMYLIDCRNCMNCFGCVGLVNKQHHIFNEPHSREEYLNFIQKNTGSYKSHLETLKKLNELSLKVPRRFARIYKSVNSDGDDLKEARNTHDSYSVTEAEDSRFMFYCRNGAKDCYDTTFNGTGAELVYENCHGFGGGNQAFGVRNFNNQNARYNEDCHECKNVFGCEGLRKKNYCILNKQYSKEEYEQILPKIIKHMEEMPYLNKRGRVFKYGEFFPIEFSPFAYNETVAMEYFPLSKEEVLERNYEWQDLEDRNYNIDLKTEDIPDQINDVSEDL